jgi:glycosyltransferase involved in cell wall biosynthesis
MDGGSTDNSLEVLRNAGNSIVWETQRDNGQSEALNRAFNRSTGDIIGWLNSDDAYYRPNVIATVVDVFVRRPDVDVVYGHAALVNDAGLLLHAIWVPPFNRRLLKFQTVIVQPAAFIRRSALRDKFVDESYDYAMDLELWLRLASTCKFTRLPKVLAIDRHHRGRKGETMAQISKYESARLRSTYGLVGGRGGLAGKLWRIATRAWGLSLIPDALEGPYAFSATSDGVVRIALRQVATPRKWMPTG